MGIHSSDHPDVPSMKGLHLFHFAMSNCSQRVRLGLEEKGLPWASHHMNLLAHEHLSADYQRLNPNGVVPTLVHDGTVVIESNDILSYLEEHFPEPSLCPSDPDARRKMNALIDAASLFQSTIKVLSHELLFRPFRKVSDEDVARFEREHSDKALVEFLRDYKDAGPAWEARVDAANAELDRVLAELEKVLANQDWLSGEAFGLADISWIVNGNRLKQAQVDFGPWPNFASWIERVRARPAFDIAVASYSP